MSTSSVRPRRDCPSFRPGHQTHWIQAKLSWSRHRDAPRRTVASVQVDDSGLLALTLPGGAVEHRWNHDPAFVRSRLAAPHRGRVQLVQPALLKIGTTLVSVCTVDEVERCPTDQDPDELSLTERLEQLGGFSVPGSDVVEGKDRP